MQFSVVEQCCLDIDSNFFHPLDIYVLQANAVEHATYECLELRSIVLSVNTQYSLIYLSWKLIVILTFKQYYQICRHGDVNFITP